LRGAYHDEIGHFARGDVADLDESISHTPTAADDEECICVVANDAPTRFHSWPARLVQRFIGI
jgi:putative transcriptional regulator